MTLKFTNPYMLLILIPFLAIVIYMYLTEKKKKKSGMKHQLIFLITRCVMGLCAVMALSGAHIYWINNMTSTVFLVDVSDSATAYSDTITEYLCKEIVSKPENNQSGIVAFGRTTSVEQFISEVNSFSELSSKPVKNATNIEAAVNYAIAIIPQNTAKRIVLVTDGQENTGDISNVSTAIKSQNIEFDVVILDKEEKSEVYVSNMTVPDDISIGEKFSISVTIESNIACNAVLHLYSGRTMKGSQNVSIQTGTNNFVFTDTQTDVGMKNYRVVLETDTENDAITLNNEYMAYTMVDTQPKLLVLEGSAGEASEFKKILDSIGINSVVGDYNIAPTNINELNEYKGVVLVNVHADDLNEGFMNSVESYITNYGGSIIACGGDSSFALGNYRDTSLEKILPVDMNLKNKKEIPKMALALVIDHSGSMADTEGSTISRLSLAKNAAIEAIDTLREDDEIGVLTFDDQFKWTFELQNPDDTEDLKQLVNGIQLGGGTSIYPAIAEAEKELEKSDAKIKHIILLTDGMDTFNQYDDLLDKINDNQITLSTVAVGGGSDAMLLQNLANSCGGRFYYTDIKTNVPRIFAQEIYLSSGEYLVNREFYPVIANYSNILTEASTEGLPSLLGYIAASPKDNSKVLLESDDGDPVLSVMQCGIGRTVAWNSDVTNEWTANYAGSTQYQVLWNNIIDWALTDLTEDGTGISVDENSGKITVKYSTENFDVNSNTSVIVTDEDGKEEEYKMNIDAPGEYKCEFDAKKTGIYSINVREKKDGEIVNSVTTSSVVQYSQEYRVFEYTADFEKKVKNMGANILTLEDDVYVTKLKKESGSINIVEACIMIILILFAIDIAFRRLQLNIRIKKMAQHIKIVSEERSVEKEELAKKKEAEKIQKKLEEKKQIQKEVEKLKNTTGMKKKVSKKAINALSNSGKNRENLDTSKLLNRDNKR